MSPAPRKTELPGLAEAIAKVVERHDVVKYGKDATTAAVEARRAAVEEALKLGATLRDLAERMDVSPETVRSMSSAAPAWLHHCGRLEREPMYRAGYEVALGGGKAENPYGMAPEGAPWNDGWRIGSALRSFPTVEEIADYIRRSSDWR